MSTPAHADPNSGILKAEPVIAAHAASWLLLNLGVMLVARYHLVTDAQWSAISLEITPIATAVLLAVVAWLVRRVVTPAWKLLDRQSPPATGSTPGSVVVPDVPTELDGLPPLAPMPNGGSTAGLP